MKKRVITLILLTLLVGISCVAISCDKKPIGGEQEVVTYTIEGAKDFVIKAGDGEHDFLDGVTVVGSDGSVSTPSVDTSKIDFTKFGNYEIEYFAKEARVKKNVQVFTPPTITVEAGHENITLDYSEAIGNKIYSGISAKDCFGNAIKVELLSSENKAYLSADGSANYGTHTLTYFAVDLAYNYVAQTRGLTIKENSAKNPAFALPKLKEDVTSYETDIALDLKGEDLYMVSLNGVPFSSLDYSFSDKVLSLDVKELFSTIDLGEYNFRAVTSGGYKDIKFSVVDEILPMVDTYGLNNWWYKVGESCELPVPKKENQNQRFVFKNTLVDSSNNKVTISDGKFIASGAGKYTYTVNAVKNGKIAWHKDLELNVFSAEEFDKIHDLGTSIQGLGKKVYMPKDVTKGTTFEYCETPLDGENSYYKFQLPNNAAKSEWAQRLCFRDSEAHVKKYDKWTMDMLVVGSIPRFWVFGNANYWANTKGKCVLKDYTTGAALTSLPVSKWFKIEIIIDKSLTKPTFDPLLMGEFQKNSTICFKNIRFA